MKRKSQQEYSKRGEKKGKEKEKKKKSDEANKRPKRILQSTECTFWYFIATKILPPR